MKKKYILFSTVLIFCFTCSNSYGQNINKIIKKHIEAHGGEKNMRAVKSLKISGKFTAFSVIHDFEEIKTASGLYYSDFNFGQHKITEGFNGKIAWRIDPWFDISFPRKANSDETNVILQKAVLFTPFFDYKKNGYSVEYIGKEKIEDVKVLKLKLVKNKKEEEIWYLDAKTYLEYKCVSNWVDFGNPVSQETYYSDFRKVDNIVFPFHIEREFLIRYRVTEIEKIELNPEINKNFDLPLSNEMKKLKTLSGEWNVNVEAPNRKGEMQKVDSTISKIKFIKGLNILQEKISYERYFPVSRIVNWTFNSETKKYRISVFNDFYSDMDIFEGKFEDEILSLDNKEINFGSDKKNYQKFTIKEIKSDSFIIEIYASKDKGKTWKTRYKFSYKRK